MDHLPFALRQRQVWLSRFVIWAAITVVVAMAGPFGTFDALGFGGRLVYWGGVVAGSIALNAVFSRLVGELAIAGRLAARLPFAVLLAGGVFLLNRVLFDGFHAIGTFVWLCSIVFVVAAGIEFIVLFLKDKNNIPEAGNDPPTAPVDGFLRRVPFEKRGELIRLEAQDHYLNVVTTMGKSLILMRMADAEAELGEGVGLRVHRSHWVSLTGVVRHSRKDGRDALDMIDGSSIPISRANRSKVIEAGFIVG